MAWDQEKIRLQNDWQTQALARSKSLDDAQQIIWGTRTAQLTAELERITQAQNQLEKTKLEIQKMQRDLNWQEEDLQNDKQQLTERAEQIAAKNTEGLQQKISSLEERLEDSRERNAALERTRTELEQQLINAGGTSAPVLQRENRRLEREKTRLEELIATLPSSDDGQRLRMLEEKEAADRAELEQLRLERSELQTRSNRQNIAVGELQSLREQNVSLEIIKKVLEQECKRLQESLGELIEGTEAKEIFPACRDIETKSTKNLTTTGKTLDLEQFVDAMQSQIAHRPDPLYYSPQIIRSFVAGLATSRLHLLQGISGTGKTSLPQVFTQMIGGKTEKIAVQAGWRDRQDLIGHYNAFEKKFYESGFLRAIYQAGTEFYKDRLYFVILDEMNLSHPEQYFADVLSGLEGQDKAFELELTPSKINQQELPSLIKVSDGGSVVLPVPNNVWFIGTANEDETTQKFAEKTFDRSHVMELTRHSKEHIEKRHPLDPVSYLVLKAEFEKAIKRHESQLQPCFEFLMELEKPLRDFEIGWGSRLSDQMKKYIPVYVATGGRIGEALDDIIATKIFRKIRGRFGNRVEDLQKLVKILETWKFENKPLQSLNILEQELKKVDAGYR